MVFDHHDIIIAVPIAVFDRKIRNCVANIFS